MGHPVLFQASTIKTITRKKERKKERGQERGGGIIRNAVLNVALN